MKKKLLFTAYNMEVGGIEKALVNLLNRLDLNQYDITLILEKKEGTFLEMIPKNIQVLEYKISENKIVALRKIYNRLKLIKWQRKLKNKFDFSCSFATYSIPGAYLALSASSNNALWLHGNYYITYGGEENLHRFLDTVFVQKFKKLVFVSEENRDVICKHYKGLKEKSFVCNNYIDGEEIIRKSKEKCDFKKSSQFLFVNVGRQEEHQKRLSRIIKAAKKLKEEGYDFQILFIGDGPDSEDYHRMILENNLEKTIIECGKKKNPYPYIRKSDAVLLSSEYEGYPVVFLEAMVLNKPIISTKVSDYKELDNKYGFFCECSEKEVYRNMKKFMESSFKIENRFDYKKYNEMITQKMEMLIKKN